MIAPNIFKVRNDWNVIALRCRRDCTLEQIERIITKEIKKETGIDPMRDSHYRGRQYVMARQLFVALMLGHTKETYEMIGRKIGKDHSTVNHSIIAVDNMICTDKKYRAMFDRINDKIKNS